MRIRLKLSRAGAWALLSLAIFKFESDSSVSDGVSEEEDTAHVQEIGHNRL